jgi:hypothetical protein
LCILITNAPLFCRLNTTKNIFLGIYNITNSTLYSSIQAYTFCNPSHNVSVPVYNIPVQAHTFRIQSYNISVPAHNVSVQVYNITVWVYVFCKQAHNVSLLAHNVSIPFFVQWCFSYMHIIISPVHKHSIIFLVIIFNKPHMPC